jgi:hypothetical protein
MAGQPIHRGNINAEIAKLAESALRENGKKETAEGYPFAIIECEDLTATQAVKEKAEQVYLVHSLGLQKADFWADFRGRECDMGKGNSDTGVV